MRGCLRLLAGLLAFLFVITAVLALFVVNLAQIVTDRGTMKEALDLGPLVVETGPLLLVEAIQEEAGARGVAVADIDTAALQDAAREIAPPEWTDAQIDTAVDALFNYLETGNMDEATLEIDVSPIVERLRGEAGRRAIRAVLQGLPACTGSQANFDLAMEKLEIPACLPPGSSVEEATQIVQEAVDDALDENPDLLNEAGRVQFEVFEEAQRTGAGQAQLEQFQRTFMRVKQWGWLLWLLPLGLLLLITLLAVRSVRDWGHWWGWPLAVTAVVALLLAFGIPAIMTLLLRMAPIAPPEIGSFTLPTEQMARRLLQPLVSLWQRRIFIQAGGMFVLGSFLIIVGFVAGAGNRSASPPA